MTDLDDLLAGNGFADDLAALAGTPAPKARKPKPTPASPADGHTVPDGGDVFAEVDRTANHEEQAAQELTAAQAAFRDRAKAYRKQRRLVEDSEFWFAVCFRTREEKDAFLTAHGLDHLGDKYLPGPEVDAALSAHD